MDGLFYKTIEHPPQATNPPFRLLQWKVLEYVNCDHWYEYFSHHHLIYLEYRELRPHFPEKYWGSIDFYKKRSPASSGPVIRSKFYSWYCSSSSHHDYGSYRHRHHRFTHHKILLPDGTTRLHCCHDDVRPPVPHFPYDPHADPNAPPVFCNAHLARPVPGEGDPLVRFLIKPCHACRTNHWYATHGQTWDSMGRTQLFCYAQPLSHAVAVAASYRPHDTDYAILGDGPGGIQDYGDEGGNNAVNDVNGQPAAAVDGHPWPADDASDNGMSDDDSASDNNLSDDDSAVMVV